MRSGVTAPGRSACIIAAGISAPVGQAWTHSPQATQVESPIGSSKSKTIFACEPRWAMPITSLTWTSRQARTQSVQLMQASRLTAIAGWLGSAAGAAMGSKRLSAMPIRSAQRQSLESASCACSRAGWSAISSSNTMRRAEAARSDTVSTTIPSLGVRMQEAASTRSPSISTMQARQLPSAR